MLFTIYGRRLFLASSFKRGFLALLALTAWDAENRSVKNPDGSIFKVVRSITPCAYSR